MTENEDVKPNNLTCINCGKVIPWRFLDGNKKAWFWRCIVDKKCQMYKAKKPHLKSRYEVGQKYCSHRVLFLDYAGIRCPCCNYNLKYTSKNSRYKM